MIHQLPPETNIQAVSKASQTLDEVSVLDRDFPDIGETFAASASYQYTSVQENTVQPMISKTTFTLPVPALEQMQQRHPEGAAGLFPEINRAYFVVKNQLCLWNYNDRQDFNSYEDTHDIVNVAIVKPKQDVFKKDITHVLIVATTHEINVIALSYKCDDNFVDTLTFFKTGIMTSSVGVRMTNILGTKNGRVFMAGDDGNIWELVYKREEGWFTSRCYKTVHSGDYKNFFLNRILDPCVSIAVSHDGLVLYQLTQNSVIKVSYLGKDGQEFNNVATENAVGDKARLMCPNSPLISANNFKIIALYPTPPTESTSYQFIAVTSTGCRLYLSHYNHNHPHQHATPDRKGDGAPNGIEIIHVRTPPPLTQPKAQETPTFQHLGISQSSSSPPSQAPSPTCPQISKCLYNNGVLLIIQSNDSNDTLTSICPDMGYLARKGRHCGLNEMYNSQSLPGRIISVTEITKAPFHLNELATSITTGSTRQFLAFTTTGLTLLLKQRPVDMLQNLIMNVGSNIHHRPNDFKEFFEFFGPIQSSALCFGIIGRADSTTMTNGIDLFSMISPPADIAKGASDLLDKYGSQSSPLKPQFSSRHDGLALYIHRLIRPLWTLPIIKESVTQSGKTQYHSTIERSDLMIIQQVLRKLQGYLDMKVVMQVDPHSPEELSAQELYELVKLLAETITFFIQLFDSDFTSIMEKFKPEIRAKIKTATYKTLLTTSEGRLMARDFVTILN